MPITNDKTWDLTAVNIALPTTGTLLGDMRQAMRRLVTEILAIDGNLNRCKGSCDMGTAGLDGVNRWDTDAKLTWQSGAVAHSWFVIEFRGINAAPPYAQLCIDLNSGVGAEYNATFVFSEAAGFTGGTTTARPTATDEQVIFANTQWIGTTTSGSLVLNVVGSNDGQCVRAWMWKGGVKVGFMLFDKPKNPIAGWTTPHIFYHSATSTLTYSALFSAFNVKAKVNGIVVTFALATLAALSQTLGQRQTANHPITLALPALGCTLWTETALRGPGAYGALFDFFYGSTAQADNDCYPSTGARTHIAIDDIIMPWPDVAPVTA